MTGKLWLEYSAVRFQWRLVIFLSKRMKSSLWCVYSVVQLYILLWCTWWSSFPAMRIVWLSVLLICALFFWCVLCNGNDHMTLRGVFAKGNSVCLSDRAVEIFIYCVTLLLVWEQIEDFCRSWHDVKRTVAGITLPQNNMLSFWEVLLLDWGFFIESTVLRLRGF